MEGKEENKNPEDPEMEALMNNREHEPVICLLGTTGCGKSTFCHLI